MNKKNLLQQLAWEWFMAPFRFRLLFFGFVRQDIKGRFAGSVMGMLWAVLSPLSNMLIYFFVFSVIMKIRMVVQETGTTSFAVYLLSGLIPWMAMSDSLGRATTILLENSSIIVKVSFPVQILPFAVVTVAFLLNGIAMAFFLCFLANQGQHEP